MRELNMNLFYELLKIVWGLRCLFNKTVNSLRLMLRINITMKCELKYKQCYLQLEMPI